MQESIDYLRRARIFLSYARDDAERASKLATDLTADGLRVAWDRSIKGGAPWRRSILESISSSYMVVVLWSANAESSAWVHSEIGFARGRGVPVFVATADGRTPRGLADDVQAVSLASTVQALREALPKILESGTDVPVAMAIEQGPEGRARRVADIGERLEQPTLLRQIAVFSTFAVPDESPDLHRDVWAVREGDVPRSDDHRRQQYRERKALERHAAGAGARLIIAPALLRRGQEPTRARLSALRQFLIGKTARRTAVHVVQSVPRGNRTILGDEVYAQALASGRHGFAHTLFTSHAPTILRAVKRFDGAKQWPRLEDEEAMSSSRARAVQAIDCLLNEVHRPGEVGNVE